MFAIALLYLLMVVKFYSRVAYFLWLNLLGFCFQIGDETFIIAALMAMRHPKSIVLSGALSALIIMTVYHFHLGPIKCFSVFFSNFL